MSTQGFVLSLLLATLISGCGGHDPASFEGRAEMRAPAAAAAAPEDAPEDAEDDLGFGGSLCTENCSDAGYAWAEKNGIADPNDCGGDSNSFFEGCMAYAQEQREDHDRRNE